MSIPFLTAMWNSHSTLQPWYRPSDPASVFNNTTTTVQTSPSVLTCSRIIGTGMTTSVMSGFSGPGYSGSADLITGILYINVTDSYSQFNVAQDGITEASSYTTLSYSINGSTYTVIDTDGAGQGLTYGVPHMYSVVLNGVLASNIRVKIVSTSHRVGSLENIVTAGSSMSLSDVVVLT